MRHTIAGRQPGVSLNERGRREAVALADVAGAETIQQIFNSPLERCRETAEPLARKLGWIVQVTNELNEVNFGQWTGRTFAEWDRTESWKQWNAFRSGTRVRAVKPCMRCRVAWSAVRKDGTVTSRDNASHSSATAILCGRCFSIL